MEVPEISNLDNLCSCSNGGTYFNDLHPPSSRETRDLKLDTVFGKNVKNGLHDRSSTTRATMWLKKQFGIQRRGLPLKIKVDNLGHRGDVPFGISRISF